jgi:pimeloyl-ACP methyl ester carboxylesterase
MAYTVKGRVAMNEAMYREAERKLWSTVGIQPDEKTLTLATTGTRVRVQIIGVGAPVVFVHGGPNSGSTWAPIAASFDGSMCLLVDRPGTGLSEPLTESPDVVSFIEFASQFVADLLDGFDFDRADVVASSLGGHIALRSAARTPERFGRMVQMACPALAPGMLTPPFMKMISKPWVRRVLEFLPPSARANNTILRQIGHGKSLDAERIPQSFFDWYLDLQRYTDTMHNDGNLIGAFHVRGGWDDRLTLTDDLLSSVATPTLFLWGEDDGFGGKDVADATVGPMPNALIEMIGDSGHLPWLDYPAEIGLRTRAFLGAGSAP